MVIDWIGASDEREAAAGAARNLQSGFRGDAFASAGYQKQVFII